MKYMRKTPVEAIQWTGDNQREVYDFMNKTARTCCNAADSSGNLIMFWKDFARRKFKAVVPNFGWVVRDGKTLQFYKDATFRKTFEEVREDDDKGIDGEVMSNILKEALDGCDEPFKGFKDVFRAEPYKETLDAGLCITPAHINIDNLYKGYEKTHEEVKLSDGLKEMASNKEKEYSHGKTKGIESDTFESVLNEMKELHAKKNKDYGDAAHVNFLKYGPVASLSRISEKMQRAEHILLSGKCEVKDEPLTETLIDIAITSAMLYMELKNKEQNS